MGAFQSTLREIVEARGRGEVNRLVTADAGMTGLDNADFVHNELSMSSVFAFKGNPPKVWGEAARLFANLPVSLAAGHTRERIGSEWQHRHVWLVPISGDVNGWAHE
jgi:hypothetical protein